MSWPSSCHTWAHRRWGNRTLCLRQALRNSLPSGLLSRLSTGQVRHPCHRLRGAQPIMPPYGTAPFPSIYLQGGTYVHPSMSAALVLDAEGKLKYGNAKSPSKTSNGSLRPYGKEEDAQKLKPLASINECGSYGADSGSEESTEGSAERFLSISAAPNRDAHDVNLLPRPMSMSGTQSVGAETKTNLNNGINHWNGGTILYHSGGQGKRGGSATVATALASPTYIRGHAQDRVVGELCLQDERDLKQQRRKQSNRESARRSRSKKQTEREELATQVEALSQENTSLRSKLNQVTEEYKILSKENSSLLDQVQLGKPEDVHVWMEANTEFSCQEFVEGNMKLLK